MRPRDPAHPPHSHSPLPDLNSRVFRLLELVEAFSREVGTTISRVTVERLQEALSQALGEEVSSRTIYRYLRELQRENLILKVSQAVRVFQAQALASPVSGALPDVLILNAEGREIPPANYPDRVYVQAGDKSLVLYELTEEGARVLSRGKSHENTNNQIKEES